MKLTAALFSLVFCTSLFARTTVTIPLEIEIKDKIITTAELNKKLKLKGDDKLLENLVVSNDIESLKAANKTYWEQNSKADDLASKFNMDFFMKLSDPHGCYTGKVSEAVTIFSELTDGPFSDQQGFFGYKYKKETHFIDSQDNAEADEYLSKESDLWANWKGLDDSILILFHIGDSGDDVNEALISKCK